MSSGTCPGSSLEAMAESWGLPVSSPFLSHDGQELAAPRANSAKGSLLPELLTGQQQ